MNQEQDALAYRPSALSPQPSRNTNGQRRLRYAGRRICRETVSLRRPARGSIQPLALGHIAGHAAQMALHRGGGLALALLRRLLVELALARFGQDSGLLAGAFEAAQSELERLVLANFNVGHWYSTDKLLKVRTCRTVRF